MIISSTSHTARTGVHPLDTLLDLRVVDVTQQARMPAGHQMLPRYQVRTRMG
ncbi:hypothetical protein [Streptomyces cinnamoneus]|uniref:hypothetical protein n=1 Tax=Streptomyces cinnamoneus TaxID=53446 RepID=UPI00167D3A18|nr:hypothetical protein [Streptomyces cinnamoneus]